MVATETQSVDSDNHSWIIKSYDNDCKIPEFSRRDALQLYPLKKKVTGNLSQIIRSVDNNIAYYNV